MNTIAIEEENLVDEIYSEAELSQINRAHFPTHIAIIMDGNRRWARKNRLPLVLGHWRGADTLTRIVRAASKLGVKVLTVFAFSTENWKRSSSEVEALMKLLSNYLVKQRAFMIREGVRLDAIGDTDQLPQRVRDDLEETRRLTSQEDKIDLVIALNYGARDEIRRAMRGIVADCLSKKISMEDLSEETIARYLDTSKWKDPDLLIRTSGEQRVSNFLLWQISYSEVYISDVLWPDFDEKELLHAILEYQQREHRLGV